jgi:hypothetical protein
VNFYKKLAFLVRNERYCSNGDGDKASNIRKYYISEITLDHIIFPPKKESISLSLKMIQMTKENH